MKEAIIFTGEKNGMDNFVGSAAALGMGGYAALAFTAAFWMHTFLLKNSNEKIRSGIR